MFQFPEFAHLSMFPIFNWKGCPIRKSTDQILFADPRSLSQLITSFFASESLGIPHTLLFTSFISHIAFAPYDLPMCSIYLFKYYQVLLLNNTFLLFHHHVNELFINVLPQ